MPAEPLDVGVDPPLAFGLPAEDAPPASGRGPVRSLLPHAPPRTAHSKTSVVLLLFMRVLLEPKPGNFTLA
jgi:hypothetical protein